ncbi:MAG: ArsR/SmtB family transcription factor [Candidatus Thorarchaeota archaeon]
MPQEDQEKPDDLDLVFKALGHTTRRRILRLLAQRPRYPYELSKLLSFELSKSVTSRVVIKHLEVLQNVGIVSRETGESDLGPDRTYYRLNMGFGLSTTLLPNTFVVRLTPHGGTIKLPAGFVIPSVSTDVKAVRYLLNDLQKIDRRLTSLDDERTRLANLKGQIIQRVEDIMQEHNWDEISCYRVRTLLNPVRSEAEGEESAEPMDEVMDIFEKQMGSSKTSKEKKPRQEISIEFD